MDDDGVAALHAAPPAHGHMDATKMLINAGADLDAACAAGNTPLHGPSLAGHVDIIRALIEARANPDSRRLYDGSTALHLACEAGNPDAVLELLRAKAGPRLVKRSSPRMTTSDVPNMAPLNVAAMKGHSEVVRAMIQQVGIERCGGATGGLKAIRLATCMDHVAVVTMLTGAGVRDEEGALINATFRGSEATLKFLLQQEDGKAAAGVSCVGAVSDVSGYTPVYFAVASGWRAPRLLRLLIDAGANTKSTIRVTRENGSELFKGTPMALAMRCLAEKKVHKHARGKVRHGGAAARA